MTMYPRETVEFIPVTVTVDGVAVTVGVEFAVVKDGERPTSWSTPTSLDGKIGVLISGLTSGQWDIYARIAASPETPVVKCGFITVE